MFKNKYSSSLINMRATSKISISIIVVFFIGMILGILFLVFNVMNEIAAVLFAVISGLITLIGVIFYAISARFDYMDKND